MYVFLYVSMRVFPRTQHTHTQAHDLTHAHTQTLTHTHSHIHTHSHTHTLTHTYSHTLTHIGTHNPSFIYDKLSLYMSVCGSLCFHWIPPSMVYTSSLCGFVLVRRSTPCPASSNSMTNKLMWGVCVCL
eukprot:GHVQ01034496.1.p2 GENE.GHVQ01034496.1~~GHVQ01034496.1.p2  ORF type:complete len:129 (+),score=26.35 GHVQ01034496.1:1819-2205(+)